MKLGNSAETSIMDHGEARAPAHAPADAAMPDRALHALPASPAPPPAPERGRSLTTLTIAGIALMALALVGLECSSRYQARATELAEADVSTVNVTRAAAEYVESTLNLVDATLYDIVEDVQEAGVPASIGMGPALAARVARTPALTRMAVIGTDGATVIDSAWPAPRRRDAAGAGLQLGGGADGAAGGVRKGASNGAHNGVHNGARNAVEPAGAIGAAALAWHRDHDERDVHLAAPILDGGQWVLPLSRRIDGAGGALAGVALAMVRLQAFQDYFAEFNIGDDGVFLLALDRGVLLARRPYRAELTGSDIRRGPVFQLIGERGANVTAVRLGLQDSIRRTYTVRRVHSYPLVVAAGVAHHEVLRTWYTGTVVEGGLLLVVLAVLAKVGHMLLSQLSRRDAAEAAMRILQSELERSNRALRDMAMKDGLTGLSNRRELDHQLDLELARASRAGLPLALVMLDVDHFKRYNDHYGHAAGDACLRAVAAAIEAIGRRPGDTAARFGGEEFAILLPATDGAGARAVAQAVCDAVHGLQLQHATSELGVVTVSAGVASFIPEALCKPGRLIEAADAGLYRAKQAGRNRVGASSAVAAAPLD